MSISRLIGSRRFLSALSAVALVAAVFSAGRAVASVTVLSGGDPGDGFSPKPDVYAAEDFVKNDSQPALTVQNVTFDTNAAALTVPGGLTFGTTLPSWGASTNDTNLATVVQNLLFTDGVIDTKVSGLTPGIKYQFDLFVSDYGFGSTRSTGVEYLDSASGVLLTESSSPFDVSPSVQGYDVANVVTAPSDGIIRVVAYSGGGGQNPIVNALAVTYTAPEPASLGLLAVGGLMLLRRRRA